jgi:UDP-N-acetyl-D-glucosamine dehydrogenase
MSRKVVCIQGLGFVGSAMAVACARAGAGRQEGPFYDVIGLDLASELGQSRIDSINRGDFPFETTDIHLVEETRRAVLLGNLSATSDVNGLCRADVVVVDVHLDIQDIEGPSPSIHIEPFKRAIRAIGERVAPGTLVVVETTVPPGTCAKIVRPLLDECAMDRGFEAGAFLLAHAYERVMPGDNYLASIVNFWRVFAGDTEQGGDACQSFLENVVNYKDFPLTRLSSTTASESAKVLENSYRAMNIAFIDEWGVFAERAGFDMFEVLKAIRMRPTHSNIRQPGFGVGGYCLTKDPLFAALSCKTLLGLEDVEFPMSRMAVKINQRMPLWSVSKLRQALVGLSGKSVLLAGVSYRQDVADTRYSPSEIFYSAVIEEGASPVCFDPLMDHWDDLGVDVARHLDVCPVVDAIVFAVPHKEFKMISPAEWLQGSSRPYILDANDCLTYAQREQFRAMGCRVESVGRGNI